MLHVSLTNELIPVSYTHLDVYKRQLVKRVGIPSAFFFELAVRQESNGSGFLRMWNPQPAWWGRKTPSLSIEEPNNYINSHVFCKLNL